MRSTGMVVSRDDSTDGRTKANSSRIGGFGWAAHSAAATSSGQSSRTASFSITRWSNGRSWWAAPTADQSSRSSWARTTSVRIGLARSFATAPGVPSASATAARNAATPSGPATAPAPISAMSVSSAPWIASSASASASSAAPPCSCRDSSARNHSSRSSFAPTVTSTWRTRSGNGATTAARNSTRFSEPSNRRTRPVSARQRGSAGSASASSARCARRLQVRFRNSLCPYSTAATLGFPAAASRGKNSGSGPLSRQRFASTSGHWPPTASAVSTTTGGMLDALANSDRIACGSRSNRARTSSG